MKINLNISYVFSLLLFLVVFKTMGQAERDNWYFGVYAGVNFDGGMLTSLDDNVIERRIAFGQIEGPDNIAVVNDSVGNLLFYTDGRVFKNKFHQNLLNTPTLEYAFRESQQVVTRNPANENQYYIFVTIQDGLMMRLSYVIVDMTLDNGLGGILIDSAHTVLLNRVGQQMTTAQHENGRDIWVICQGNGTFSSFLVSPAGVSNVPVRSQTGLSLIDGNFNNYGAMQASPNNELIAGVFPDLGKMMLFEFNNLTGKLNFIYEDPSSTPEQEVQPAPFTSVEFSTNSKVLYVTHNTEGIRQYDLSNLTQIPPYINVTPQVGSLTYSHLKLGPDRKIYVSNRGRSFLGAIKEPNTVGLGCDYEVNVFNFNTGNHLLDLPTFLLPERPEGLSFLNICLGESTELKFGSDFFSTTYEWDLGDGTILMGSDTINYTYAAPGTYTVSIQGFDASGNPTFSDSKDLIIYDSPTIEPIEDIYNCLENTPLFFIDRQDDFLGTLDFSVFDITYYLNEEDALKRDNDIIEITPQMGTQTIWVRVDNRVNFQCFDVISFDIITPEFITVDIDRQQYLCDGQDLILEAPDGYISYEWNTGSHDQNILVDTVGDYTLTVVKDFGQFNCEATVRINVDVSTLPIIEEIRVNDWSQNSNSIEVIMSSDGNYEYSVNNDIFQTSNVFNDLPLEDYQIYVKELECGEVVQSEELFLLYYNKFFTPNGDGFNDYWQIINSKREADVSITIYDRYGKLIAVIDPQSIGWDGTYNGAPVPSSDYWYRVTRSNGKTHTGHFTLKK